MTSNERIEILIRERGYIVLASNDHWPVGKIVDIISGKLGGVLPQPFAVIKETDKQDAIEQEKVMAKYGYAHSMRFPWRYFYRVSTD